MCELSELIDERKEGVVNLQRHARPLAIDPQALHVELRRRFLERAKDDDGKDAVAFVEVVGAKFQIVAHHAGKSPASGRHRIALAVAGRLDDLALARAKAEFHVREPLGRTLGDAVREEVQRPVGPVGDFRAPDIVAVQRKRFRKDEVHAAELVVGRDIDDGRAALHSHFRAVVSFWLHSLIRHREKHLRSGEANPAKYIHTDYLKTMTDPLISLATTANQPRLCDATEVFASVPLMR